MCKYYSIFRNNICPLYYIYNEDYLLIKTGWLINKINFIYNKKSWFELEDELVKYFNGEKINFHNIDNKIKINKPNYKDFTNNVINQIMKIPYGKTVTYKEIAFKLNNVNAARAVGTACSKNNIPLIIPCHRVVAVNVIGGYMGKNKNSSELLIKKKLLKLEGVTI